MFLNEIIQLEVANLHKCFRFLDFEFNMEKRKRIENDIISLGFSDDEINSQSRIRMIKHLT